MGCEAQQVFSAAEMWASIDVNLRVVARGKRALRTKLLHGSKCGAQ